LRYCWCSLPFSTGRGKKLGMLFWVNTFAWAFDPRKTNCPIEPFITYPFQDRAFLAIKDSVGDHDLFCDKSRDMGASWGFAPITYLWHWLFRSFVSFLMVSRKEDLVDKRGDPKCLFWKVLFVLDRLPKWMVPDYTKTHMHLHNNENGSTIDGESTTGDLAVGDRRTSVLLDEFSLVREGFDVIGRTRDVTRSRHINGTPRGTGNAHHAMMEKAERGEIAHLRMHWSSHPEKNPGLYTSDNGKLKLIDRDYWLDQVGLPNSGADEAQRLDPLVTARSDYTFLLDGRLRSPWYDNECLRASHPLEIAVELDIDYLGSSFSFFDDAVIRRLLADTVRPAFHTGELLFDTETLEPTAFDDMECGRLSLWIHLDNRHPPRDRTYVVGADIATGTGASSSVLSVFDRKTGEKVAQFVHKETEPQDLAQYAVALAKWFSFRMHDGPLLGALLIWEANGPGELFGNEIVRQMYPSIFFRSKEDSLKKKKTDKPGWWSSKKTKLNLIGEYKLALRDGLVVNRSETAVKECREYVFMPDSSVAHKKSLNTIDNSAAGDNHGDHVIADALCWRGMREVAKPQSRHQPIPSGSLAERMAGRQAEEEMADVWDVGEDEW